MRIAKGVWHTVAQQRATLKSTAPQLQGKRIRPAGEIQLGDFQNTARRCLHFSSCGIGCAGEPLHFKSTSIGNRVTFGFLDEHDNVLSGLCSCGILRRDGDAIEDAQVIKPAL